jgi:hypothetical protein
MTGFRETTASGTVLVSQSGALPVLKRGNYDTGFTQEGVDANAQEWASATELPKLNQRNRASKLAYTKQGHSAR